MNKTLSRGIFDLVFASFALLLGWRVGGWTGVLSVAILAVLEVSLSFDNAVVNAKLLNNMSEAWRQAFLTWGMFIAVFGMRLVFPILIVAGTAGLNPLSVVSMAYFHPETYALHLQAAHVQIAGFGGAFLLTLFFGYFMDEEKDSHWLTWLEAPLTKFGAIPYVGAGMAFIVTVLFSWPFLNATNFQIFIISATLGILTHEAIGWIGRLLGNEDAATGVAKAGLAGFLYIEMIDASLSFDGVIGAFAVSNEILIIMAGLGVGAMAVRSMTLYLVEKGTLAELPYLEHSAFWAIGALAGLIYASAAFEVPEVVSGLTGAGIIALGVASSLLKKKGSAWYNEV